MAKVPKPKHLRKRTFLREWRDHRDVNQEEIADWLGIDRSTLSRIERGILPYNQDLLERLAFKYSCEVGDLLNVNPGFPDKPRLIFNRLANASPAMQEQAFAVIEALLKAS